MSPLKVVANRTGYTRNHVRVMAVRHKRVLGLKKRRGRWVMTPQQIHRLARIVQEDSGPRCKLGETR